jgi:hypothetical protein
MGSRVSVQEAALNNAEWCHAFCRAHRIAGHFDSVAWSSADRTPPFYPDAVTLAAGCSTENLLSRVDARPGCSIKDSFVDLDLSASGFEVMFTADWVCNDRARDTQPADGWSAVADEDELERWEAAWGESPIPRPFFRAELLTDARIRILAESDGEQVCGGAIANRSGAVIGLSNVFDIEGDLESAWRNAASAAQTVWGRMPVVGYDRGDSLDAAHRAGFETVGHLAVWVNRRAARQSR